MELKEKIEAVFPQMTAWRRFLHQNPELSFEERKTAQFVADKLAEFGIETVRNVGGHGVVGRLVGGSPGPVVALRADMDALPIQDEKTCDYASKVPGVMHACGHDAHTSALLGAASVLGGMKDRIRGEIRFLFQPAEEISPGGAMPMIRDGALDKVDVIYGVHLWTPFPVGSVFARSGAMMAAADEFSIEVKGRGGHGGLPHTTVDSIVTAGHLIVNLQSIVSRSVDPVRPGVLSIGRIEAGKGFNVIADTCRLIGTVRAFDEETRLLIVRRMEEIVSHTCSMFGAEYRFDYKHGYPPLINDEEEYGRFRKVSRAVFGEDACGESPMIMAAEDFAYYLREIPGCFVFVGAGNEMERIVAPHHHPKFDIDENAMKLSTELLISLAFDYLESQA